MPVFALPNSVSLARVSPTGATASFASIPGTFKHLQIIGSVRLASGTSIVDSMTVRFNADSGSNYTWINGLMSGTAWAVTNSGSPVSSVVCAQAVTDAAAGAGDFSQFRILIPDYTNTSVRKTIIVESWFWTTLPRYSLTTGRWDNTAAITQVDIGNVPGANFAAGSFLDLIGLS